MNFDFLKTKHYYFYYYVANARNGNLKGYNLVEVTAYFWVKPRIKEIMEFVEKSLKEELNGREFVIINFYKVK